MIDWLTSQGYTVHLSPGLVVLERGLILLDYPTLAEAYAAVFGMEAMDDA